VCAPACGRRYTDATHRHRVTAGAASVGLASPIENHPGVPNTPQRTGTMVGEGWFETQHRASGGCARFTAKCAGPIPPFLPSPFILPHPRPLTRTPAPHPPTPFHPYHFPVDEAARQGLPGME